MERVAPISSSGDADAEAQPDPYTAPGCCFPLKKIFMRRLVEGRRRGASKRRSSARVLETLVDELKTEVRLRLETPRLKRLTKGAPVSQRPVGRQISCSGSDTSTSLAPTLWHAQPTYATPPSGLDRQLLLQWL